MIAIIDIGTNSTLLLIAEITSDGNIQIIEDLATVTKLGEGLFDNGIISDIAAERTLKTLAAYQKLCIKHGAKQIITVGTAALRNAKNALDFCIIAKKELHLDIRIISGEKEANLTFDASTHDFGKDICVIDIGGGSTEIISGDNSTSLPMGCVNLTECILKSDPVTKEETIRLRSTIRNTFNEHDSQFTIHDSQLIATAGTATTLMAMKLKLDHYNRNAVHGKTLSKNWLQSTILKLESKSIEERKALAGLPKDRADVILAGAVILDETMHKLGYDDIRISDAGVRWGILYENIRK